MNLKRKIKKINLANSIGFLLLILGITFIIYNFLLNRIEDKIEEKYIETYINNYDGEVDKKVLNLENKISSTYNYVAILDIPKINLKKGLVMSTKNFTSINYAVSIDKNSQMPDEKGNLILYAHSGNSKISFFKNINKLENNDIVNIYYNGKNYSYKVNKKYNIKKTGLFTLGETYSDNNLVLLTCIHNTDKQLVIICTLENVK